MERLASAFVKIIHSELGTEPLQIVESAIVEFEKTRAFERIYVVFDRDEHRTYNNAIAKVEAKDKKLKNDEKKLVSFEAIVSVPSFELWLLLHFHDQKSWIHRDEVLAKLRQFIPGYAKGMSNVFEQTRAKLELATNRGAVLQRGNSRLSGKDAYTDVQDLVTNLLSLRSSKL